MNQIYGFEGEVKAKYTAQMFALFSEVFEWLPLAQCINGKVLVRGHPGDIVTWCHCLPAPIGLSGSVFGSPNGSLSRSCRLE